jgi:hypothetical protein
VSEYIPHYFQYGYHEVDVYVTHVGAFLYSRSAVLTPEAKEAARGIIRKGGLDPNKFCVIRNQCFLTKDTEDAADMKKFVQKQREDESFWWLGQKFFQATETIATELSDW